jgi:hydrogenase maturation protease
VRTLVVGIGSTILGDDGIGVHIVRKLKEESYAESYDIIELGTAGLSLLDYVEGYDRLIIVDAIVTGAPPGTVHELWGEDVITTAHLGAGHESDLPATLALGRRLGKHMPKDVVIIAVEATGLDDFSEQLTPEVEMAIPEALARINSRSGL